MRNLTRTHCTSPEYVVVLAREFRKNPTDPEKFLWSCVRSRKLHGFKFRRQHPVGRYIADFFCAEAALVVELDGVQHTILDQAVYDRIRDEEMAHRGLTVLRIANAELINDPVGAVSRIANALTSI